MIALPALASFVKVKKDGKSVQSKAPIHLFFLIMLLLLALKDVSVGADTETYLQFFKSAMTNPFGYMVEKYGIEWGYHILEFVNARLFGSFQLFEVLLAFITVVPIWIFYAKNSENPYLSVILFATIAPFSLYFSGVRQAIAIAFVPLAFHFVKKKKLVAFILTVVFAFFFHQSALLLLLLYPIYRIRITRNFAFVMIPILFGILIFNQQIFNLMIRFLGEKYIERYAEMTATGAYTMLLLFIVFAVYCYFIPDESKLDAETKGLRNIMLLCVAIQCFAPIHTVAMRMNYYFLPLVPLLIPKIIAAAKDKNQKLARMSVVVMSIFFTVWFFINAYTGADILHIFPYVPFWS